MQLLIAVACDCWSSKHRRRIGRNRPPPPTPAVCDRQIPRIIRIRPRMWFQSVIAVADSGDMYIVIVRRRGGRVSPIVIGSLALSGLYIYIYILYVYSIIITILIFCVLYCYSIYIYIYTFMLIVL